MVVRNKELCHVEANLDKLNFLVFGYIRKNFLEKYSNLQWIQPTDITKIIINYALYHTPLTINFNQFKHRDCMLDISLHLFPTMKNGFITKLVSNECCDDDNHYAYSGYWFNIGLIGLKRQKPKQKHKQIQLQQSQQTQAQAQTNRNNRNKDTNTNTSKTNTNNNGNKANRGNNGNNKGGKRQSLREQRKLRKSQSRRGRLTRQTNIPDISHIRPQIPQRRLENNGKKIDFENMDNNKNSKKNNIPESKMTDEMLYNKLDEFISEWRDNSNGSRPLWPGLSNIFSMPLLQSDKYCDYLNKDTMQFYCLQCGYDANNECPDYMCCFESHGQSTDLRLKLKCLLKYKQCIKLDYNPNTNELSYLREIMTSHSKIAKEKQNVFQTSGNNKNKNTNKNKNKNKIYNGRNRKNNKNNRNNNRNNRSSKNSRNKPSLRYSHRRSSSINLSLSDENSIDTDIEVIAFDDDLTNHHIHDVFYPSDKEKDSHSHSHSHCFDRESEHRIVENTGNNRNNRNNGSNGSNGNNNKHKQNKENSNSNWQLIGENQEFTIHHRRNSKIFDRKRKFKLEESKLPKTFSHGIINADPDFIYYPFLATRGCHCRKNGGLTYQIFPC